MATFSDYEIIDPVADYGVVGNGSTNNSPALLSMRSYMIAHPEKRFIVNFPNGHYCWVNPWWVNCINWMEIYGNGSKFECIRADKNESTLSWKAFYDDANPTTSYGDAPDGYLTGCPQARFDTVAAGGSTIHLKAADGSDPYEPIANFSAGDYVFLWGFDQQFGGYPPNLRYHEWKTIDSVDTGAGTITFTSPLKYSYQDNLYDVHGAGSGINYGIPRIFRLDRSVYKYPRFIGLYDLALIRNRNFPSTDPGFQPIGDVLHVRNCDLSLQQTFLGFCRQTEIRNCTVGTSDIDKLGGDLLFDRCIFTDNLHPATGFDLVKVERSVMPDATQLGSRAAVLKRNILRSLYQYGVLNPVNDQINSIESVDNIVINDTTLQYVFDPTPTRNVVTSAISGTSLTIASANKDALMGIKIGSKIVRTTDYVAATVTAISWDSGTGNHTITVDAAVFTQGDTLKVFLLSSLVTADTIVEGPSTWPVSKFTHLKPDGTFTFIVPLPMPYGLPHQRYHSAGFSCTKVKIEVIKPHENIAVGHENPFIIIDGYPPSGTAWSTKTYTGVLGYTITGISGDSKTGSNTITTSLTTAKTITSVRFQYGDVTGYGINYSSVSELPKIRVTFTGAQIV